MVEQQQQRERVQRSLHEGLGVPHWRVFAQDNGEMPCTWLLKVSNL